MKMLSLATIFKTAGRWSVSGSPRVQDVEELLWFARPAFWPEPAADTPGHDRHINVIHPCLCNFCTPVLFVIQYI